MRGVLSFFLLGTMMLAASPGATAKDRPIVAVFDIEDQGSGLSRKVLRRLTNYLSVLLAEGGYQVIPRNQILERLRKQKARSFKKCYDMSCQVDIGRELAAQKSLSSQIIKIGRTCRLTATLYNLKRAATDKAASAKAKCTEEDLGLAVEEIARKLTTEELDISDLAEEARKFEERKKAEMKREAEAARKAEKARKAEIARKAKERREAEARRRADVALREEEAQRAEEARKVEAARELAEAREMKEARHVEEPQPEVVEKLEAVSHDWLEIQVHGCLRGSEFSGEQDSVELSNDPGAAGRVGMDRWGMGARFGVRLGNYHTTFLQLDYLWESWSGEIHVGSPYAAWSSNFSVLRIVAGYRFAYPALEWLAPFAELAAGTHVYFPIQVKVPTLTDKVELLPENELRFALMLGLGVRFLFLQRWFATVSYLWDLPVGDLTSSSFILGAGAHF